MCVPAPPRFPSLKEIILALLCAIPVTLGKMILGCFGKGD